MIGARIAAIAGALLAAPSAAAQVEFTCAMYNLLVPQLEEQFGEKSVAMGLSPRGSVVEIFVSPSGTFSIIVTNVHGLACLVQAGTDWEPRPMAEKRL